jgi:hypothetical protein
MSLTFVFSGDAKVDNGNDVQYLLRFRTSHQCEN